MTQDTRAYIDLIKSQRDLSLPLYLLVDAKVSLYDYYTININQIKSILGSDNVAVVPRPNLLHDPDRCPHVCKLADAGSQMSERVENDVMDFSVYFSRKEHPATTRYVCGWLQTELGLQELAENLAQRMLFPREQPEGVIPVVSDERQAAQAQTAVYAMHEPLRHELVSSITAQADPSVYAQWLWPISQWIVPASNKGFICTQAQKPQGDKVDLGREALVGIIDAPLVARTLSVWLRHISTATSSPEYLQGAPLLARYLDGLPQNAAYIAFTNLRAGDALGLRNESDLVTFSVMRLIAHPRFDAHPETRQMVNTAIAGKGSLTDMYAEIDHDHWMKILYELDHGGV